MIAFLGAGGMGEVYRARDSRLGREVAIKVLPADVAADPKARARFEREARAVAALSHPNILAIYEFDTEDGLFFAVTELLEGETLRERVAKGPIPWREAVGIAAAIADGLATAHSKGIVHRDLKPENVFVTQDGRVKILDFGLARSESPVPSTDSSLSKSGMVMGTYGYMSPEQARGERAGAASDVFSLGSVLYEMIAGRPAFARGTAAETTAAVLKEEPPALGRTVPRGLHAILRRCLEKDPARRPASAAEVASALRALPSKPSLSPRIPVLGTRRRRVAAALAVALGIGLGTLAIERFAFAPAKSLIPWADAAPPLPDKPSIVVLPFTNLSGDPDEEYFSDGMARDIITDLSKVSALFVIDPYTAFTFKGEDAKIRDVGRELGVRYVLGGSVQRAEGRVRINVQLADAATGEPVWAERYDRAIDDVFAVQGEITQAIVAALRVEVREAEQARIRKIPTENLSAYESGLHGEALLFQFTKEANAKAEELFQRAIALDPDYARAHTLLGTVFLHRLMFQWDLDPRLAGRVLEHAEKAVALDPTDPSCHSSQIFIDLAQGKHDQALARA
ncbi:MAG: protein kinase domain-containing protein, partial [Candidatus Binatia bacterium]